MADGEITTADGIFIKEIRAPRAGVMAAQHAHQWDHTTLLAVGAIRVWRDGVADPQTYRGPHSLFIPAGVKHAFLIMADNTLLYCIHNLHGKKAVSVLAEHDMTTEDALALLAEM
jgi:quercetin dioxygenase-like cupin family protein